MQIGIIGSGMIGATTARLFAAAGHSVILSNSRGPDSLRDLVAGIGNGAKAATVPDAVRNAEVVLLAIPWRKPEALPKPELVAGKIVIDAMNPYAEGGGMVPLGDSSSSEETAKRLPGARIVKAFNTIYFQHLATQGRHDLPAAERRAIFVAGEDAGARLVVARLIEDIGFGPVDAGSLREGGLRLQPESPLYNRVITAADAARALRDA